MEPEGSLLYSQVPNTCPYPEPAQSSPYPVSQVISFPQVSLQKPCIDLSSPHRQYMPCPSHFSQFFHPNSIGCGVQIIKLLIV